MEIESIKEFQTLLERNPGLLIIKIGATWCGPCRRIESQVDSWFQIMPDTVQTVLVDCDRSCAFYTLMKKRKMLQGIPGILAFKKGNLELVFDDAVNNSDIKEIDEFFLRCLNNIQ
jgi:thioredoxin-like negative regulator of GroEL